MPLARVALLAIARSCPDTARSIMREAVDAKVVRAGGAHPGFTVRLGDVVANPRGWRTLYGKTAPACSVAARSEWLGSDILAGMVGKARKDDSQFVTTDPATLGHTVGFLPGVWFEPCRETAMLQTAWENVGPRSTRSHFLVASIARSRRMSSPSASGSPRVSRSLRPTCCATRIAASRTVSVRPTADVQEEIPLHRRRRPPTASQRLLLARLSLAGMGAPVNQPIFGR